MYEPIRPERLPNDRAQFEASSNELAPEEKCLTTLFDMADVDKVGAYKPCSEFFVVLNGQAAPEDLRTNIHVHRVDANKSMLGSQTFPGGANVVAAVSVGFDAVSGDSRGLHNIDFVKTPDGLRAFEKEWFIDNDERVPKYVRELDANQLTALAADAAKIAQTVVDTDAERLKLGPLVEEAGPDGLRRFHISDILSVIAGRLLSARGVDGLYDILGYMTDDEPYTTQLGRFAEECKPYLQKQFDEKLADFYEPPEEAMADALSVYKWLGETTRTIGESLLTVRPIPEADHARIDVQTELELDYGSDFMKKVITFDPEAPEDV